MASYPPRIITNERRMIEDLCRDLVINNDHVYVVLKRLQLAIEQGLSRDHHEDSSVKCYPTYIRILPNGKEKGQFLALDLGGTNFRVLLIEIGEDQKFAMESKVYPIPAEIMVGTGEQLFDHIADCLVDFVITHGVQDKHLPLGFTFSFPTRQEGLARGILTKWTKGFNCSGVVDHDVVGLLKDAIHRHSSNVKIDVCAVLNDTTGCLMSCAWKESRCRIGLILGTGTNACYIERIEAIQTIEECCKLEGPPQMIINTEWGAFGDNKELEFIRTKWDQAVDAGSLNPGKQTFEKMISGMYIGELARLILVDMISEDLMFNNIANRDILRQWGKFGTHYISEIEADPVGEYQRCRTVLQEIFGQHATFTDEDCSALRYICELISRRAGFMVAAGVSALLKRMDYKDVVVAIDGSLFRYHPHFANVMRSRIQQMMGIDYSFDLMLSTDGSGRGAALVAAVLEDQKLHFNFCDSCAC